MKLILEEPICAVNLETRGTTFVYYFNDYELDEPMNPKLSDVVKCCECEEPYSEEHILDGWFWFYKCDAAKYVEGFDIKKENPFHPLDKVYAVIFEKMKK